MILMLSKIEQKVQTLHAGRKIASEWRRNNKKIIWTNGCFDLLHYGHIKSLCQARDFGAKLIVGLNSDASIVHLKGSNRPILNEQTRSLNLAALEMVDMVILFDEPTPLDCIISIRPDVIVKGGDYDVDEVVGGKEVMSWGGKVEIIPFEPGYSTSSIINRINRISNV